MIGRKICTRIPYKSFKEKIRLTKKYEKKHKIEVYKYYILIIY